MRKAVKTACALVAKLGGRAVAVEMMGQVVAEVRANHEGGRHGPESTPLPACRQCGTERDPGVVTLRWVESVRLVREVIAERDGDAARAAEQLPRVFPPLIVEIDAPASSGQGGAVFDVVEYGHGRETGVVHVQAWLTEGADDAALFERNGNVWSARDSVPDDALSQRVLDAWARRGSSFGEHEQRGE